MIKLDRTRHLLAIAISIVSISYLLSANVHYNLRMVYYKPLLNTNRPFKSTLMMHISMFLSLDNLKRNTRRSRCDTLLL